MICNIEELIMLGLSFRMSKDFAFSDKKNLVFKYIEISIMYKKYNIKVEYCNT